MTIIALTKYVIDHSPRIQFFFAFENQDHDMFRESARKFFREYLHPQHKKFEADGKVSNIIPYVDIILGSVL